MALLLTGEDAGVAPAIVHHNWFGPLLPQNDRNVLQRNLRSLAGSEWQTVVWTSKRFTDPEAYQDNTTFLAGLSTEFALEERDIEDCGLASGADIEMLQQCWEGIQQIRQLRETCPELYTGKVTFIAAMSDFCRMLALHAYGGVWADIGDTSFGDDFPLQWTTNQLGEHKFGFRVAMNHSGIVRNPSQHLLSSCVGSRIVSAFLERMRQLWVERISSIDVTDVKFDGISTTLAWTGMGGTTGPIMKQAVVNHDGEEMNMMEAWKAGCCHLRFGVRIEGTKSCDNGMRADDIIMTWSNKSWMLY